MLNYSKLFRGSIFYPDTVWINTVHIAWFWRWPRQVTQPLASVVCCIRLARDTIVLPRPIGPIAESHAEQRTATIGRLFAR